MLTGEDVCGDLFTVPQRGRAAVGASCMYTCASQCGDQSSKGHSCLLVQQALKPRRTHCA